MTFKLCPNCRSAIFYVEPEPDRLTFLRITPEGDAVGSREPHDALSGLDLGLIHCSSCSWEGPSEALYAPEG